MKTIKSSAIFHVKRSKPHLPSIRGTFSTELALIVAFCIITIQPIFAQEATPEDKSPPPAQETEEAKEAEIGSTTSHALSLLGSVKYPEDFKRFDYVNRKAPKGGTLRLGTMGRFDTLNPFAIKGEPAAGLALIYESMMTQSYDEPASQYGRLAEQVELADDYSWAIFTIRSNAKWHDGKPVTPEDVIFSLEALRTGQPFYRYYYRNIASIEKLDEHRVKFNFDQSGNRELAYISGEMFILPKHFWQGMDAKGNPRDFTAATLEPPLASGPYRVSAVDPGRNITYERVENYWGRDLPVNIGQHNFDKIRFNYFKDEGVVLEAFFAGEFDFRFENISKYWATQYNNRPAVKEGRIKKELIPTKRISGMQGYFFNTRRAIFADHKVREALSLIYNFEWANKNLFYGQYTRHKSYFDNSELAATGLPSKDELKLLKPFRDQLPSEVFEKEFRPARHDTTESSRANLRRALDLLGQAGWTLKKDVMTNEKGEPFEFTVMLLSPSSERIAQSFAQDLKRIGINLKIRMIDTAQYQNKMENYDFDMVTYPMGQSHSPGNEQRDFWGSDSADRIGGRNIAGIKDPVVDNLVEKIIFAEDRQALITATRALDRVLLWSHYVIPHWYIDKDRIAHWSSIEHPKDLPGYAIGMPDIWWSTEVGSQ